MKKLLPIVGVFVFLTAESAPQKKKLGIQTARELRIALRLPSDYNRATTPTAQSSPQSLTKPINGGVSYEGIKITGGTQKFRETTVLMLERLKKEAPLHHAVAVNRVKTIKWGEAGSYAWPRRGDIVLGKRDWDYSQKQGGKGWFLIAIIHEVQHCNIVGDESEGGATWASFYYAKQLNVNPYLTNYQKAMAMKLGYNSAKWEANLAITRATYLK